MAAEERLFKLYTSDMMHESNPASYYLVFLSEGNIRDAMRAVEREAGQRVTRGLGIPWREPRPDERVLRP